MSTAPTVVYIAGIGHSGSTLLDLLISSHSAVFGVGEAKVLSSRPRARPRRRIFHERACDCGATPRRECAFWQAVDVRLGARNGLALETLELEDGPDERFHEHNRAFYGAVAAESGASVLVDSSKSSDRMRRLLATPGLDVRPIHLIRDPRGVACSHGRRGRPWTRTLRRWLGTRRELARALAGRDALEVRYESLAREPERVLSEVMAWLGFALEPGQLDWTRREHHHLAGNPFRRERQATIRVDDAWRRELGWLPRAVIPCVAWLAGAGR